MTVPQTPPSILNTPVVTKTNERLWLPLWQDADSNPIANDAGLLPIKPHWQLESIGIIKIRVFKAYSDAQFANENNAINSSSYRGFGAKQCWMNVVNVSEEKTISNDTGYEVDYAILCTDRPEGWEFVHPNASYVYDDGSDIKPFQASGVPYIGNLDGAGNQTAALSLKTEESRRIIDFSSVNGIN